MWETQLPESVGRPALAQTFLKIIIGISVNQNALKSIMPITQLNNALSFVPLVNSLILIQGGVFNVIKHAHNAMKPDHTVAYSVLPATN